MAFGTPARFVTNRVKFHGCSLSEKKNEGDIYEARSLVQMKVT